VNVGQRDAQTRVAHLLCELAFKLEDAGFASRSKFDLPLSQVQLCDATALTPIHINRVLHWLGSEGLIEQQGRKVLVEDWAALAEAGGFDESYLRPT
jgi:CRP-like cAMP-binding protein